MYFVVLGCIFFGELFMLYAEQLGAKLYGLSGCSFSHTILLTLVPLLVGAFLLVIGYMLGLKYHQNIWVVTAISFSTILIAEPLFNYFFIGQTPEFGAGVGVLLGFLGLLAVTFL
ncbi:MAG: hypothetical protein NBV63_00250 [Candidatus Pacebacteria bacterium]|nr:hypothetical protein [Candidatus Paceibacterota bacterium]